MDKIFDCANSSGDNNENLSHCSLDFIEIINSSNDWYDLDSFEDECG